MYTYIHVGTMHIQNYMRHVIIYIARKMAMCQDINGHKERLLKLFPLWLTLNVAETPDLFSIHST